MALFLYYLLKYLIPVAFTQLFHNNFVYFYQVTLIYSATFSTTYDTDLRNNYEKFHSKSFFEPLL